MTYHPNLFQEIHHRYSGSVKVKHSTQALHAVDAHRAHLAYSEAAEAIGALLVKYAADIEIEAASRKAFAENIQAERDAKRKDLEAQIKAAEAEAPGDRTPGFWSWLGFDEKYDWKLRADHAMRISKLHREIDSIGVSDFYDYTSRRSTEEQQAQNLQDKMEEKSHLAYVVEGNLMLTTEEAIEMSKAEDGTLAEEVEKTFRAMVMRNGEAK